MSDERRLARARALRAAQVVTLGLASAVAGCSRAHEPGPDSGAREVDSGRVADAGCSPVDFSVPPTTQVCCEAASFWWDASSNTCIIAVPGPFVPPAMA